MTETQAEYQADDQSDDQDDATEKQENEELLKRYKSASAALKVSACLERLGDGRDHLPEALRAQLIEVILNQSAIINLLMDKGVFTQEEGLAAVVAEMESHLNHVADASGVAFVMSL